MGGIEKIIRRPDGSPDIDHYTDVARDLRSQAFRHLLRAMSGTLRHPTTAARFRSAADPSDVFGPDAPRRAPDDS